MKGKHLTIWLITIISILSFGVAAYLLLRPLGVVIANDEENYAKQLASSAYDQINAELLKEYGVAQTMAHDIFLIDLLKENEKNPNPKIEEILAEYMTKITEGLEYNSAYLVIDSSREYYAQKGFNKIVDPLHDRDDIWYAEFLESGEEYEFKVDIDAVHGKGWTVFINNRIEDEEGNLLGVCGVGVTMKNLQSLMEKMQQKHGIKIYLVNENGMIQVSIFGDDVEQQMFEEVELNGKNTEYQYQAVGEGYAVSRYMQNLGFYLVVQKEVFSMREYFQGMIDHALQLLVMIIIALLAGIGLLVHIGNIRTAENGRKEGLTDLSMIYVSMHLINLKEGTETAIKTTASIEKYMVQGGDISTCMYRVMSALAAQEYRDDMIEFTDLASLAERMKGLRTMSHEFVGSDNGWCRARFIAVGDDLEHIEEVIFAVERIEEEKRREEELIKDSLIDELTRCYNRKAYEMDVEQYKESVAGFNMVYASIDVNGLKAVNDDYGHAAGDELIRGAALCLKKCIGSYGRVYRMGGDEFAAVFFADAETLDKIEKDVKSTVKNWKGNLIDELSISCGYAGCEELPDKTISELASIADQRMYEAKEAHYRRKGIDRRGQQEAYQALCESYTKILKVNLTTDTFYLIQADELELSEQKGYSDKISEWLRNFAETGQVHPEDKDNFISQVKIENLRQFFKEGYSEFDIHYRRMTDGEYRAVKMELVTVKEYSHDNQVVFLYVKTID